MEEMWMNTIVVVTMICCPMISLFPEQRKVIRNMSTPTV